MFHKLKNEVEERKKARVVFVEQNKPWPFFFGAVTEQGEACVSINAPRVTQIK